MWILDPPYNLKICTFAHFRLYVYEIINFDFESTYAKSSPEFDKNFFSDYVKNHVKANIK